MTDTIRCKRLSIIVVVLLAIMAGCERPAGFSERSGMALLVTPNLDDDDLDGIVDSADAIINGPQDREDLLRIKVPFAVDPSHVTLSGPGRRFYLVVEIEKQNDGTSILSIEGLGTRSRESHASLVVNAAGQHRTYNLNIRPFVLTSSLDHANEVFVVEVPSSKSFVNKLKEVLAAIPDGPRLSVLSVENGDHHDVWIQDATEIGVFEGTTLSAGLRGLRVKHSKDLASRIARPLDRFFATRFLGRDRAILSVGDPLPNRKWIDWFGNLEVSPPINTSQCRFPYGRILTGRQGDLSMHDSVMKFLEDQEIQWPPVILDTGFLMIGHVDEIVNFIPSPDGFKVMIASPAEGRKLLEELMAKGHGDAVLLEGKKEEARVSQILRNKIIMEANAAAESTMKRNQRKLQLELGLTEGDFIHVPMVFKKNGGSLWPNIVNGLVVGNRLICPKPFGPVIAGEDVIESEFRAKVEGTGVKLHFLDDYEAYSRKAGEIHCGTNAVRELRFE